MMEKKIFLLIAIFCIALVKSDEVENDEVKSEEYKDDDDDSPIPEYTGQIGVGYPGDFLKAVLLSDASSLWGTVSKHECFKENYNNGKEYHRQATEEFSEQLLEEADKMIEELSKEQNLETFAQQVKTSAKALADSVIEYQKQFSELVENDSFDEIDKLKEEYEKKIRESDKTLDDDILKLKGETTTGTVSNTIAKKFENTRDSKLTDLTNSCKDVMALLEECEKEEKS